MRFDTAADANPTDQRKVIGRPLDRVDGALKTAGVARYAYERHDVAPQTAYGFVVGSAISKGRIVSIDTTAASKAPGTLAIVTANNAGPLGKSPLNTAKLLGGPEIEHYHQAIALVVAETFEQARSAAQAIHVRYERSPGAFDLEDALATATMPERITGGAPDTAIGDFDGAYEAADVTFDATYSTPDQTHAMLEPHATTAAWVGDELTLWTSTQMVDWTRTAVAVTLGIPKEKVQVSSPYIGGGFGAKLYPRADVVLAALGARIAGRAVKVALQRPLVTNNTVHRPATIQRVRIGATTGGKITAIAHESWSGDLPNGKPDGAVEQTRMLYAGANRKTATRLAVLDLPEANAMRAPGEATGHMALEVAMDEMAAKLRLDPVQFRLLNDTDVVPDSSGRRRADNASAQNTQGVRDDAPMVPQPFSQRQLAECLRVGAERFGWNRRNETPGQEREGKWLVGMGVAAAYRAGGVARSAARVRLDGRGFVTVESDMTDIGTGSYTIMAQTAAEMMGVTIDKVVVRLGESDFPVSAGSGGQRGGASATAGVHAACTKLREAVLQILALPANATFADGHVAAGGRRVPLASAARDQPLAGEDGFEPGDLAQRYRQATFGAHFVEVAVDRATAEVRVRRMLAVCASGRILNPKLARSQIIGAMTMGVGAALMEELVVDKRFGFFVNHDLASYEVPAHADIPYQDVIFLDEPDPLTSPMKAKGVGELGLCGVAAAINNAIFNATGVRVRKYPITLDKLIGAMPAWS